VRLYFRVEASQIGYIRFIVESYEGLAQVTSLPGRAQLEWIVPRSLLPQAEALARALAAETLLVPIERPEDWSPAGDQ
jgi:hypothetical protein